MTLFLTEKNVRSKPFIKRMFTCMVPGTRNPNDQNWTVATYISEKLEHGFNVGIRDAHSLFWMTKPFAEGLFQSTFYWGRRTRDYALRFIIEIRTEGETVYAGEFYFRSDRNPFEPKIEGEIINPNISPYLEHPYKILVTTEFIHIFTPPVIRFVGVENDEELVLPKPLKKIFKHDQCVICLDRKPNVLFVECKHTCVCEECEKIHPTTKCPCCRTKISERLLI